MRQVIPETTRIDYKDYSDRQWKQLRSEKFKDTTWVIRTRKSKKNRQYNGQRKKINKRTNNNLQNTTHETKDWAPRTPLKHGSEL